MKILNMENLVKIQTAANWFFGNYCTRKCYDEIGKQREHWDKLQELAKRLEGVEMTHSEFLNMLRNDKTICDLSDEEWKNRKWSWKRTECPICKGLGLGFRGEDD
ncbi:hypothetical protein HYY71_01315 [Candidatus Woesearchaeota archaeon]|nr:hypothetical protein [Candidatus Woesearchaeota archaeon]